MTGARLFLVYVFAAGLGGILLAVSIFSGHDHEHDIEVSHEVDTWGILSIQFWTHALAFFGVTGLLLRFLAGTTEPWTALASLGVGFFAGAVTRWLRRNVGGVETTGTLNDESYRGKEAKVLVPFEKGTTGQVRLSVAGKHVDLLASSDEGAFTLGEVVWVLDVANGRAVVGRHPLHALTQTIEEA